MSHFITQPRLLTSGEIKREARAQLKGHWKEAVLISLIPVAIAFIVTVLISWTYLVNFAEKGITMKIQWNDAGSDSGLGIFGDLLTVNVMTSISFTFLDMIRGIRQEIVPLKDVFRNFKQPWMLKIIGLFLVRYALTFLWSLLFIIPGIIKSYSYSQCYFILYDEVNEVGSSNVGIMDCIAKSRAMMKGHKMDLFLLQFSFFFWYILGVFTLGIAFLWISPYQTMSEAVFMKI